jgi:hypothetical protein
MIDENHNFRSNHLFLFQATDIKYGRMVTVLWFALVFLLEVLGSILFIDHYENEFRAGKYKFILLAKLEICCSSLLVLQLFINPYILHP